MSKTFDYETAQVELAIPEWNNLDERLRDLVLMVCKVSDGKTRQEGNLLIPFPSEQDELDHKLEPGFFQSRFDSFDEGSIALASNLSFRVSHWAFGENRIPGVTWKFSRVADGVLHDRLGGRQDKAWPRIRYGSSPSSDLLQLSIHDGVLAVGMATSWSWRSKEVGLATRGLVIEVREVVASMPEARERVRRKLDGWGDELFDKLDKIARRSDRLLNLDRFMVDRDVMDKRAEVREWPKTVAGWPMSVKEQVYLLVHLGRRFCWSKEADRLCREVLLSLGIYSNNRLGLWREEVLKVFPQAKLGLGWPEFWASIVPYNEEAKSIRSVRDESNKTIFSP